MANRYQDLLSILPSGKFYDATGEILPFLDRPHEFQVTDLDASKTFRVFFNAIPSGQTVSNVDGVAIIRSIAGLPPDTYDIKLVDVSTTAERHYFITVKNTAAWLAAYAEVLNSLDDDIDEMDAARSLATVTAKYIEDVYGRGLRQSRPTTFRHEDYRNFLRQLRPAYRHFGAHPYGLSQAVEGMTSVSPLTVPDAWRPHWVLGSQLADNGDFQHKTKLTNALFGPAGAISSSPIPELATLNRQSRYWVHPAVGVGLISSGFRAPPEPQRLTVTVAAAGQYVDLTGVDESGMAFAETVPDPSVASNAGTYVSTKLFASVTSAQRVGPGIDTAQVGIDERFVKVTRIGDQNRTGGTSALSYYGLDGDNQPVFAWGGGDQTEVVVPEPLTGYGLSLTVETGGGVRLADTEVDFTGEVRVGDSVTISRANADGNNGTFPVTKVDAADPSVVHLLNPAAVNETSAFHWEVVTSDSTDTPFQATATLKDVDRHAVAIGRIETAGSIDLDPTGAADFQQYMDRLYLELDDFGVVKTKLATAAVTPAAAAAAINAAFTADPRYGASYAAIASVLTGTEGDNEDVLLVRAPNGRSLALSVPSKIKIHPGPADGSELIFGLPRSSTHLTTTPSGYTLSVADASRFPPVLVSDPSPFRRRYKVRIRGLRHLTDAYALINHNVSGTQAEIDMTPNYAFTSADIGGHVFLADTFHVTNDGMHKVIDITGSKAIIVHEGAAAGGVFNDSLGFGSSGTASVWGKGEVHTVIDSDGAVGPGVLTLDPSEVAPYPWCVGAIVEMVEEAPYVVEGTEGLGELDVAVDIRYRPFHDFGDSISNVAGNTWRLLSTRADFTGQTGATIIFEGCENLDNDGPFVITADTSTTVDFTNPSGVAESSPFEWHIDLPNGVPLTDNITASGATMPDGWEVLSAATTVRESNNHATATDIQPGLLTPSRVSLHSTNPGVVQFSKSFDNALAYKGLPLTASFWAQEHSADASVFLIEVSFDGTNYYSVASKAVDASVLTSVDASTQYIGPLDPVEVEGSFFVPFDATTVIVRFTRTPVVPADGTISIEQMTLRSLTGTGLTCGDNTVPRSQKRAKFGEMLYIWSVENLSTEEKTDLGLPLDGSSVPAKPGHVDYITNAHGYWDRIDVSEVDDSGVTPIRNNIRGVYDSVDWAALEISGGLTRMQAVVGTPSRLSYARPSQVTFVDAESLDTFDGGDGPGTARANLALGSNHDGPFPQAPNTGRGTKARMYEFRATPTTFVNADGLLTTLDAGTPIPLPDDIDVDGNQPWEFTAANQVRINAPYFDVTSSYALDYELLMRVTVDPFQLDSGTNTPADYVWLIDFARYLRHEVEEALKDRTEQASFKADFTATLSERADQTQSATLIRDNGSFIETVHFSDWSFVDSKTIKISSNVFDTRSIYSFSYTAKVPRIVPGASLLLEWRAADSESDLLTDAVDWQTVELNDIATPFFDPLMGPNVALNLVQPWHQMRVTLSNVQDVRDVRVYGLGVKGAHLYGAQAFAPGILTPGP